MHADSGAGGLSIECPFLKINNKKKFLGQTETFAKKVKKKTFESFLKNETKRPILYIFEISTNNEANKQIHYQPKPFKQKKWKKNEKNQRKKISCFESKNKNSNETAI